jgi:cytochrome c-type biogenesis protein CcmH/NrfG
VHLNPENANTYYSLGMVYAELGRNEDALMQYRKTLQRDGNHTGAHERIARLQNEAEMKAQNQPATYPRAAPLDSDIVLIP